MVVALDLWKVDWQVVGQQPMLGSSLRQFLKVTDTVAWRALCNDPRSQGCNIAWMPWYNQTRMHSTLNYASTVEFENNWMDATMRIAA